MTYVDGFVLSVPTDRLEDYRAIAELSGKVWMEHGALQFIECAGDDLSSEFGVPFPKLAGAGEGETVMFSWIMYESREQRDEVNKKVMADPRIKDMDPAKMPFDCQRMTFGGFKPIVELQRDKEPAR